MRLKNEMFSEFGVQTMFQLSKIREKIDIRIDYCKVNDFEI